MFFITTQFIQLKIISGGTYKRSGWTILRKDFQKNARDFLLSNRMIRTVSSFRANAGVNTIATASGRPKDIAAMPKVAAGDAAKPEGKKTVDAAALHEHSSSLFDGYKLLGSGLYQEQKQPNDDYLEFLDTFKMHLDEYLGNSTLDDITINKLIANLIIGLLSLPGLLGDVREDNKDIVKTEAKKIFQKCLKHVEEFSKNQHTDASTFSDLKNLLTLNINILKHTDDEEPSEEAFMALVKSSDSYFLKSSMSYDDFIKEPSTLLKASKYLIHDPTTISNTGIVLDDNDKTLIKTFITNVNTSLISVLEGVQDTYRTTTTTSIEEELNVIVNFINLFFPSLDMDQNDDLPPIFKDALIVFIRSDYRS